MSSIYLSPRDRAITDSAFMRLAYRGNSTLQFQFPPMVTSDSRRISWRLAEFPGADPLATISANSARNMTLKIEYIVENDSLINISNSRPRLGAAASTWTIGKIKEQLNTLKGYFTGMRASGTGQQMVVEFAYALITGPLPSSVRINNVDVTYEGPHVGEAPYSHPLKSIATVDISTISQGNLSQEPAAYWDGLAPLPEFGEYWY